MDTVLAKVKVQVKEARQRARQDLEQQRKKDLGNILEQQRQETTRLHETAMANLRATLATKRNDALKTFDQDISDFQSDTLGDLRPKNDDGSDKRKKENLLLEDQQQDDSESSDNEHHFGWGS